MSYHCQIHFSKALQLMPWKLSNFEYFVPKKELSCSKKSHPNYLKIHCFLGCNKIVTNVCLRSVKFLQNNWEGTVPWHWQVNSQSSLSWNIPLIFQLQGTRMFPLCEQHFPALGLLLGIFIAHGGSSTPQSCYVCEDGWLHTLLRDI